MRRTRFGVLVLATGWAMFPLALVIGSVTPALLGVVLVAIATTARVPEASVTVERDLPARAAAGDAIEVTTRVSATLPVPVFVRDAPPPGVVVEEATNVPGRGTASVVTRVRADAPGMHAWRAVEVRYQDAWGLVEEVFSVPLVDHVEATPEATVIASGERAGRQGHMGSRSRSRSGFEIVPEIDRLRDYQPGDRLRDVDWGRSSRFQRLISRELRRDAPRPVIVLVHAGASMRRARRMSKMATTARAAAAVVSAAHGGGLSVGLVAWSERGLEAQTRLSGDRTSVQNAVARLAALPAALPATELPEMDLPRAGAAQPPSREERAFLAAASTFRPQAGGSATPVEAALASVGRVSPQPSIVVAFVDAEESPSLAITVVDRLRRKGHVVVVAAPASGAHHYARREVDDRVLDRLVSWRLHREEVAQACRARRVPFLSLGPHGLDESIAEVIRSAA